MPLRSGDYCASCHHRDQRRRAFSTVNFLFVTTIAIACFPMPSHAGKGGSTKTSETEPEKNLPSSPDLLVSDGLVAEDATVVSLASDSKNSRLLRSGILAVAQSGTGSSSSSQQSSSDSASAVRDRDRDPSSAEQSRKLKMASTHNKGRGSASIAQLPNKLAHSGDNAPYFGPVPGVDPDKYSLLFNRSSEEMKIKRALLYSGIYDKTSRPVTQDRDNVTVHIGISLYHILDTNEKYQTISLLIAVRLKWRDAMLRWNPEDYNGVDQIWLPSDLLWTPDIVINNNADHEVKMQTNAIVESTGDILWMYPQLAKIYCTLDVRNFPFDVQHCDIKFFSWTYNGYQIDLMTTESENPSYFDEANQEWNVISIRGKRNVAIYVCCPEPFPDISFTLIMKRRSMFYIFNLIFPCMLIYAVAFLGFFLPIESNEKINLEVTILLALVVFLMVIGETMPPSPDAIPLLGMLYASTMMMVSIALVSAVAVTNVYYKEKYGEQVPRWLFRLLYWNADLPCPKCKMPQRMLRSAQFDKTTGMASRRPFKNTSFMMAPPGTDYPGVDYTVNGVEIMPANSQMPHANTAPLGGGGGVDNGGIHDSSGVYSSSKSPPNRRAAWIKASSGNLPVEQATPDGAAQCTPLNQQISMCSDDEFSSPQQHPPCSTSNTPGNNNNNNKKRTGGADSPVWKHRGNGVPGGYGWDVWVANSPNQDASSPYTQQAAHPQQAQHYQGQFYQGQQHHPQSQQALLPNHLKPPGRSSPATYVRQLSEGGHSTRFVRTDAGCVHITIDKTKKKR